MIRLQQRAYSENVLTRFCSIEGARGWLAWTVVLSHVAYASGIYIKGIGPFLGRTGVASVSVFMIISGFVITHLIIQKREPYSIYIFRRFMRIFPLFALTCAIGFFCIPLAATVSDNVTWGDKIWRKNTIRKPNIFGQIFGPI